MFQLLVTVRMSGLEDFERITSSVIISRGGSLLTSEAKKVLGEFDTKLQRHKAFRALQTIYGSTIMLEKVDT